MNNNSGIVNPAGGGNLPLVNPNPAVNTQGINPADLMAEIQSQLLSTSGAISSNNSKIEDTINGAIDQLNTSNTAAKGATTLAYDKSIDTAKTTAANQITAFQEAQRGFATNVAALTDLRTQTAKSISDLEDSKQQALLTADSTTASKISDLILQKYQFEQQATQQVFTNLVSMSNLSLQQQQETRLQQAQTSSDQQAVANIALKYGVTIAPGDTLQTIINKAQPNATAEEKLQLDTAQANLELTQANTKKALADASASLANAGKNAVNLNSNDFDVFIKSAVASDSSVTADALKAKILAIPNLTAAQRQQGYDAVDSYFKAQASSSASSAPGSFPGIVPAVASAAQNIPNVAQSITDFIFGKGNTPTPSQLLKSVVSPFSGFNIAGFGL